MNELLAKNLKFLRKKSNLQVEDVALFLDLPAYLYVPMESNASKVSIEALEQLADLYNFEEYDLLTEDLSASGFVTNLVRYDSIHPSTLDLKEITHFHKIVKNYVKMSRIMTK